MRGLKFVYVCILALLPADYGVRYGDNYSSLWAVTVLCLLAA